MKQNNLISGNIRKQLIKLAIPLTLMNLLQSTYQIIDAFWIGKLGKDAVSAITISLPILFLIMTIGMGINLASGIIISHLKGKYNHQYNNPELNKTATQSLLLIFITSSLIGLIGFIISKPLLILINTPSNILNDAENYMKIIFLGNIFAFTFMNFSMIMRGLGNVKLPTYIIALSVFLNLFLDPLFIFGYKIIPTLNVLGAAVSTLITQLISSLIAVTILIKGNYGIKISLKYISPDIKTLKKLLKLGLPASIEFSVRILGFIITTILVIPFGTTYISSYGIGSNILRYIMIPLMGFSMATATMIGQNLGAGKYKRLEEIKKESLKILTYITLSSSILLYLFSNTIAKIFIPNNPDVIYQTTIFIKIISLAIFFMSISSITTGILRGLGKTKQSMIINLIYTTLQIALALILLKTRLGVYGIYLSHLVAAIIMAISLSIFLKKINFKIYKPYK